MTERIEDMDLGSNYLNNRLISSNNFGVNGDRNEVVVFRNVIDEYPPEEEKEFDDNDIALIRRVAEDPVEDSDQVIPDEDLERIAEQLDFEDQTVSLVDAYDDPKYDFSKIVNHTTMSTEEFQILYAKAIIDFGLSKAYDLVLRAHKNWKDYPDARAYMERMSLSRFLHMLDNPSFELVDGKFRGIEKQSQMTDYYSVKKKYETYYDSKTSVRYIPNYVKYIPYHSMPGVRRLAEINNYPADKIDELFIDFRDYIQRDSEFYKFVMEDSRLSSDYWSLDDAYDGPYLTQKQADEIKGLSNSYQIYQDYSESRELHTSLLNEQFLDYVYARMGKS